MNKVSPADRGDPWIVEREGVVGSFWGFGFDCSGLLKDSREIFFSFEGGGGGVGEEIEFSLLYSILYLNSWDPISGDPPYLIENESLIQGSSLGTFCLFNLVVVTSSVEALPLPCRFKDSSDCLMLQMQNVNNIVLFPVDSLLKGDLRGARGDLKRPFDRAVKDYETKYSKLEKEKKAHAKEAGFIRSEVTAAEVAEDLDPERKMFQLQMCEVRSFLPSCFFPTFSPPFSLCFLISLILSFLAILLLLCLKRKLQSR